MNQGLSAPSEHLKRRPVDRPLRLRIRIFAGIFVVALAVVVADAINLGTRGVPPLLWTPSD